MRALHHLVGQRAQGGDVGQATGAERVVGLRAQALGQRPRRRQAQQGYVGGLVGRASLPAVLPRVAESAVTSRMSSTTWKARPSAAP
jgi:hypothetical protein